MYTPQKLELAIELPHEEIRLTVAPPITETGHAADHVDDFHFDPAIIEELFADEAGAAGRQRSEDPIGGFSLARDLITKGLYDRAQAEIARVLARGGDKISVSCSRATDSPRRDCTERRWRDIGARSRWTMATPSRARAPRGRCSRSVAPSRRRPYAEALVEAGSTDVNLLLLAAEARVASLDKPGAREILLTLEKSEARNANVLKRVGDLYASLGDANDAIGAYRASLGDRRASGRRRASRSDDSSRRPGDDTGAIRELETVLVTAPNHDAAVVELVGPYRRTGRSRSALPRSWRSFAATSITSRR